MYTLTHTYTHLMTSLCFYYRFSPQKSSGIHIYICIYTLQIRLYIHRCIYVHTHIRIHKIVDIPSFYCRPFPQRSFGIHIHACTLLLHMSICIHMYIYAHAPNMYTYAYTYVYIHTCTYNTQNKRLSFV